RIVEAGSLDDIFYDPQHPYTWGLLGSITRVDGPRARRLPASAGMPPSLVDAPEGCYFRPRCPHEFSECPKTPPLEARFEGQHQRLAQGDGAAPAADADGVPGPLRLAQPAQADRADHRRAAGAARRRQA